MSQFLVINLFLGIYTHSTGSVSLKNPDYYLGKAGGHASSLTMWDHHTEVTMCWCSGQQSTSSLTLQPPLPKYAAQNKSSWTLQTSPLTSEVLCRDLNQHCKAQRQPNPAESLTHRTHNTLKQLFKPLTLVCSMITTKTKK